MLLITIIGLQNKPDSQQITDLRTERDEASQRATNLQCELDGTTKDLEGTLAALNDCKPQALLCSSPKKYNLHRVSWLTDVL
jgi:hypothetical protein